MDGVDGTEAAAARIQGDRPVDRCPMVRTLLGALTCVVLAGTCTLIVPGVAGAAPAAPQAARHTALCASATSVTRLVVRRVDAFPQNHVHFSFPASVVVDRRTAVRKVARAVCALPVMPTGAMHCPMDLGITYHLGFSRPHRRFREVVLDATGCQTVQGLTRARWIARSPRFWRDLGLAMRLKHPSWSTFRGSTPS